VLAPSGRGLLAYLFWHWPHPDVPADAYEAALIAFHRQLAARRTRGGSWRPPRMRQMVLSPAPEFALVVPRLDGLAEPPGWQAFVVERGAVWIGPRRGEPERPGRGCATRGLARQSERPPDPGPAAGPPSRPGIPPGDGLRVGYTAGEGGGHPRLGGPMGPEKSVSSSYALHAAMVWLKRPEAGAGGLGHDENQ